MLEDIESSGVMVKPWSIEVLDDLGKSTQDGHFQPYR
jgi:hypothetical protein